MPLGSSLRKVQKKIRLVIADFMFALRNWRYASRNVFIGRENRFHKTALFDTSQGGRITIGDKTEILNGCLLMTYGGSIKIGSNCSINPYTIIYGHGRGVSIGNNVLIAAHCVIIPANHIFARKDIPINQQGYIAKGITIQDNVWLGAGCRILDGVTIGSGSIIAAGCVVNKDVEPFSIVAGIPGKKIKDI